MIACGIANPGKLEALLTVPVHRRHPWHGMKLNPQDLIMRNPATFVSVEALSSLFLTQSKHRPGNVPLISTLR